MSEGGAKVLCKFYERPVRFVRFAYFTLLIWAICRCACTQKLVLAYYAGHVEPLFDAINFKYSA